MRTLGVALAMALMLAASPAEAARKKPDPSPSASPILPIQGISVDVQPLMAAPGMPAAAPDGTHVEQPPLQRLFRALPLAGQGQGSLKGFKPRARGAATPTPSPASNLGP